MHLMNICFRASVRCCCFMKMEFVISVLQVSEVDRVTMLLFLRVVLLCLRVVEVCVVPVWVVSLGEVYRISLCVFTIMVLSFAMGKILC